jgi:AraC-like DNA-binding protein
MKPRQENILSDSMYSFHVNHAKLPFLDNPWHFHAAYELLYVIKSKGKRFVGDSIENFYAGDLVFMGPHLPHVWKNGQEYYQNNPEFRTETIVVQFKEDAFGDSFFNLSEMQSIQALFKIAKRGLKITGKTHEKIASDLFDLLKLNRVDRFCKLLQILDTLAKSADLTPLTSKSFEKVFYDPGSEKINKVFEYVANNFRKDIELNEVAKLINMSKPAFCRYFKQRSLKTFLEYLSEVRINYACKLLIEDRLSISEISHECGFNSHSYFNRQFRNIKKQTPKDYCKEHRLLSSTN